MPLGKAYLSSEEIRPLAERSDLMGALLLLHCWGVIAAALGLFALWPSVLTFVLAVMLIGSRQLGLAILMHDAAHVALFKTRRLNEVAGEWFCGWPILADMRAYRHYHLTHHRFTQTEDDPDIVLSRPFPTTRASLIRKFVRDLTGQTGVKQLFAQIVQSLRLAGDHDAIEAAERDRMAQSFKGAGLGRGMLAAGVVMILMGLAGEWWWGFAFWLLPLLTWFQLVLRIRNIAEHGATDFTDDPLRNVRTTRARPLMRLFVAPYWVNYHLEHHLVMHVPCWRLRKLHDLMVAKGHGARMRVADSYWRVLGEVGWHRRAPA
ncbi:MAG: fatty acid desaturase family protein [Pseudomonadota bacterium]